MSYIRRTEREVAGGDAYGSLDGTTPVEVIPSPAAGYTRVAESLRIVQKDDVTHTIRVSRYDGVDYFEIDNAIDLPTDGVYHPIQSGVDEFRSQENLSVWVVMDEAMSTTNPTWIASWRDEPLPV